MQFLQGTSIELRQCFLLLCLLSITACKNRNSEVPFPTEETGVTQPIAQPVKIGTPKNILWNSPPKKIKPLTRKFEWDKIPWTVYDSSDFISFSKPPEKIHFNLDSLSERAFLLDRLPSRPVRFETFLLERPQMINVEQPQLVGSSSGMIYTFGEPLAGTHISFLFKDKVGFLWIATDHGLYKYDGERLVLVLPASVVPGINTIVEDRSNRLWIGTLGNGIIVLDNKVGVYKHLGVQQGLNGNDIVQILIVDDGSIWIMESSPILGQSLEIIDPETYRIKNSGLINGISTDYPIVIIQDNHYRIWIGNPEEHTLNIIDLKKNKISVLGKINGLTTNLITALLLDREGNVWITGHEGEVNRINRQQDCITHFGISQGLKKIMINRIMEDINGNIWMGTFGYYTIGNGVEILDPEKGRLKIINTQNGLSSNDIEGITEDQLGQIWIGSRGGLDMVNKNGNGIVHFGNAEIYTLTEDAKGLLWIGTKHSGIQVLDTSTGLTRSLTMKNGLSSDSVENIIEKDGRMMVVTDEGLDIIDSAKKNILHFGKSQGLISNWLGMIFCDRQSRLWIGNYSDSLGIDILDLKSGTIQNLGARQGFGRGQLADFKQDKQGFIWLGHVNGVMDIVDSGLKTIRYFNGKNMIRNRWSDISMLSDEHDNMWIGTELGIFVMNEKRDSLINISTSQGLIGNYILSLNQFDGKIYAGTKVGLSVITPPESRSGQDWRIESFGSAYGIRKLENSYASDYITKNGQYIWEDLGFTILSYPKMDKINSAMRITGVDIFNQAQHFSNDPWVFNQREDTIWNKAKDDYLTRGQLPLDAMRSAAGRANWDSVTMSDHIPVGLRLPYKSNYLKFHYAPSDLAIGDAVQYRYILEGVDQRWSEITSSHSSQNYSNLSPGDYTFKVSGKGRNSPWSSPASFAFTILTPWWQTVWFYALCFVLVASSLYAFYRYRILQILKLQNIRNSIASDLHDDIGSTLSSISIMSELAKKESPGSMTLLDSIGESANLMVENMRDLVWAVNPKNDRFGNILQRMHQFASEILEAKGIAFQFHYDESISTEKLSMEQRKKIYLFFKEAINNAAKHSRASQVEADMQIKNGTVTLSIADNGVGFVATDKNNGNGLSNFGRRALELGGKTTTHSEPGRGTRIELFFKII